MDEDPGAGLLGTPRALGQERIGAGVERVWGDAGEDATARIGAVALDDRVRRLPVRRRPGIDQRMADHGADARRLDARGDAVHVAQPIGDAGDAVQQELGAGGAHGEHMVLDRKALLARHRVARRPEFARLVLGHAAIEGGRGMGVHVDQAGRDQRLAAVDQRVARPGQAARRAEGRDGIAFDADVGRRQEFVGGVDRKDGATCENDRHVRPCSVVSADGSARLKNRRTRPAARRCD